MSSEGRINDVVLRAENLGKQYRIGRRRRRYRTLRGAIREALTRSFGRVREVLRGPRSDLSGSNEKIWALQDVSFEITRGEVVGIVGRNGSGKTTLLKILSRITPPTVGRAEIRGRIGSLLEVGSGFHPELTGRENIFLSGAILGMKRAEIQRKFDEIVNFAEVSNFVDTPVKHYSSGMAVRLAFAVAAHLETEILLIDEVLAVGDARFQRKCLNRIQAVSLEGRTVLFVSHNMAAVTRLCRRVILLDEGRLLEDGPAHRVVHAYLSSGIGAQSVREWNNPEEAPGDHVVRLRAVRVRAGDGRITGAHDARFPIGLEMEYDVVQSGHVLVPHFDVLNEEGLWVFTTMDQHSDWRKRARPAGRYVSTAWIPANLLAGGMLFVAPAVVTPRPYVRHFSVSEAVAFGVVDSLDGDAPRGDLLGDIKGVIRPLLRWRTEFAPDGPISAARSAEGTDSASGETESLRLEQA